MKKIIEIYEGEICRDRFGSWDDCNPGLYIGMEMIETIFNNNIGKHLRITIEEIDPENDE